MRPKNDIRVILVERDHNVDSSELGRFGNLYINGTYFCDTLEKRSAMIPEGVYQIVYCDSPKFKRKLPLVYGEDVPSSWGIRIHAGNTINDTSGCILLGEKKNNRLVNSRKWVDNLCNIFDHDSRYEKTVLVVTKF